MVQPYFCQRSERLFFGLDTAALGDNHLWTNNVFEDTEMRPDVEILKHHSNTRA